jgi:riboflavin biosynthesis pyrimidine reductase
VRQIFPACEAQADFGAAARGETGPAAQAAVMALADLYAYPEAGTSAAPWLRANMVASADGAAWLAGRSGGLSGRADRLLFFLLRSLADVILVGASTVRAERYRPAAERDTWAALRHGRAATPPIAVVTRELSLDPDMPLLTSAPPGSRTIVLTTAAAPAARRAAAARHAEVIVAGADSLTPEAIIAALAGRGYRRLLTEGGPRLLTQITMAGLLDDLCLTISPVLEGGWAGRILAAGADPAGGDSDPGRIGTAAMVPRQQGPAAALRLAHVLEDDGYLLCRYLRDPV